jgi:hypothetical protein
MVKCGGKKRIILSVLIVCLFVIQTFSGCKKKDQSEGARQTVPEEKTSKVSVSEKIEPVEVFEKIDLRILYAGLTDTDRAKDFVDFLSKHFNKVETTDYKTFIGNESADFNVTIIDYDGRDTRAPIPKITRKFSHATITIGSPGADLCSRLSLKTGYL